MSEAVGSPVGSVVGSSTGLPGGTVAATPGGSWWHTLGWAAYLACSWTWCIGMFLPVLLIRDYGVWGFVVFAVPNVVGAGAMGWVLRRKGHSEQLVAAHHRMGIAFSTVTIAFQCFFFFWMLSPASPFGLPLAFGADSEWPVQAGSLAPAVAMLALIPISLRAREPRLFASLAVWLISIVIAVFVLTRPGFGAAWRAMLVHTPRLDQRPIPGLGVVCILGFLLCPYLDLTFHRARQSLPGRPGVIAFALGFGVLFLAMILFTLGYAGLTRVFAATSAADLIGPIAAAWLTLHVIMQLLFTIYAHAWELPAPRSGRKARRNWTRSRRIIEVGGVVAILVGAPLLVVLVKRGSWSYTYAGLDLTEIIYRLFMSFYGLVAPAYVWLCMIPRWRNPARPVQPQIAAWLLSCAIAAPMYWKASIEGQTWWFIPGAGVVLLARLFIPRPIAPTPAEPSGAPVPVPTHPPTLAAAARAGPDDPRG